MRLVLEKRQEHSVKMALLSPVIALCLTVLAGGIIFALRGLNPFEQGFKGCPHIGIEHPPLFGRNNPPTILGKKRHP
jgi:ABC-type uncharacterized transport system permease subunit